ncbi:MAG: tryptophan synthase subunit beta [Candidatus Hydrogenedentota bacterium]|nr:MAG: tryptophan synthase subunit beta [Candidatus Hydrogenedentota bacterium]
MNGPLERYFGEYGGVYVPETLVRPVEELTAAYEEAVRDATFLEELSRLLRNYAGRPTPLTPAQRLSEEIGAEVFLKREDLLHTGAHKINNALGQALLAKRMGKTRLIAETGAGQHGVATATAAAKLGLSCDVYMGTEDMRRQELNVFRMELLGARVIGVDAGSRTLKDAINEALRDWVSNLRTTHYVLGSVLGPAPYPAMIRNFHRCIGDEARRQILEATSRLPDTVIACVGGGSNAIGMFSAFLEDRNVELVGVEGGGCGKGPGEHAARYFGSPTAEGKPVPTVGVLHGTKTVLLQDADGNVLPTHSISAGLDYPAIGPEHAALHDTGRVRYVAASDHEVLAAFETLCRWEGILPALESAHAVAYLLKEYRNTGKTILVNLSGRGDKDVETVRGIVGTGRASISGEDG